MRFPTRGLAALLLLSACGDDPLGPEPPDEVPSVRTVLFHRQDTGENLLLNSDGTSAGALALPGALNVPIGVSARDRVAAIVHGTALGLVQLSEPAVVDTLFDLTADQVISFVSFSGDARFLAFVNYEPFRGVVIYDRANRSADTLDYGPRDAVLPPVFSPDNARLAIITQTPLTLYSTVVYRNDATRVVSEAFGFSRFLTIPIFGWPAWTDEGLLMAFVREGGADPDTLLSAVIDPARPGDFVHERFRAVLSPVSDERPELVFDPRSTYAYAPDGNALVLGANPNSGSAERHALYLVTRNVSRVQLLLDDPAQVPIFPNFVN